MKATNAVPGGEPKQKTRQTSSELSQIQKQEIKAAFDLFDTAGAGVITPRDLKVALQALGTEPNRNEIAELFEKYDKEGNETIDFHAFFEIMKMKMSAASESNATEEAFQLFDKNTDGDITFDDLKQMAMELGETMTDEDLMEMIQGGANGARNGRGELAVSYHAF